MHTRAASRNGLDLDEGHPSRRKWVGPGAEGAGMLFSGERIGGCVLSEVTAGTDMLSLLTLTEGQQDDEYC